MTFVIFCVGVLSSQPDLDSSGAGNPLEVFLCPPEQRREEEMIEQGLRSGHVKSPSHELRWVCT